MRSTGLLALAMVLSVLTLTGASCNANGYTILGAPTVTAVAPLCGPPGSSLTITGTNYTSDAKVTFTPNANCTTCTAGSTPLTCPTITSTAITCTVPALKPGNYDETVTEAGGTVTHAEPNVAGPPC